LGNILFDFIAAQEQ